MRVRTLLSRWGDPALAVALGGAAAAEVSADPRAALPAAAIVAAATGLVLVGRRRLPLLDGLLVTAGVQGVVALAPHFPATSVFLPAILIVSLYSMGRHARGIEAWLEAPVVVLTIVLSVLGDGGPTPGDVALFLVFCGLPWAGGLAIRLRIDRVAALREQAAAIEARTRQAVADERARIARELHDVVSHAIAVTVLQARGSRHLVGRDDAAVRDSLAAVERVNQAALADMRRLLAVLRGTDAGSAPGGLAALEALVDQVRAAGVPVALRVEGSLDGLRPEADRAAYRVAQEALTNVLKHGGRGATARVLVRRDPAGPLEVDVESTVGGAPALGGGRGLTGLRERVGEAGGALEAGPVDVGWRVRATLPVLEAVLS